MHLFTAFICATAFSATSYAIPIAPKSQSHARRVSYSVVPVGGESVSMTSFQMFTTKTAPAPETIATQTSMVTITVPAQTTTKGIKSTLSAIPTASFILSPSSTTQGSYSTIPSDTFSSTSPRTSSSPSKSIATTTSVSSESSPSFPSHTSSRIVVTSLPWNTAPPRFATSLATMTSSSPSVVPSYLSPHSTGSASSLLAPLSTNDTSYHLSPMRRSMRKQNSELGNISF